MHNWFKQKITSVEGTAAYQQQQQARQQLLAREEEMKEQYVQQFQQGAVLPLYILGDPERAVRDVVEVLTEHTIERDTTSL